MSSAILLGCWVIPIVLSALCRVVHIHLPALGVVARLREFINMELIIIINAPL